MATYGTTLEEGWHFWELSPRVDQPSKAWPSALDTITIDNFMPMQLLHINNMEYSVHQGINLNIPPTDPIP